jgi:hypothetical protein
MNGIATLIVALLPMSMSAAHAAAPHHTDDDFAKLPPGFVKMLNEGSQKIGAAGRDFVHPPLQPEYTFDSIRAQFAGAKRPEAGDMRLRTPWRCYSLVNNTGSSKRTLVDEVTFDQFNGKILSSAKFPAETLEYKPNAGGLYASFRGGKKNGFHFVPVYRLLADGRLIREVSILYLDLPLLNPDGINFSETLGISRSEYGSITRLNSAGTVYSYGLCSPVDRP